MATHRIERGLGYQLHQRRLELGLSQEEVSEAADISRRFLAQIESGANFGVEILIRLAAALRIKTIMLSDLTLNFGVAEVGVMLEALGILDRIRSSTRQIIDASSELDDFREQLRALASEDAALARTEDREAGSRGDVETFLSNARMIGQAGAVDAIDETFSTLATSGGAKLRPRATARVSTRASRTSRRR